MALGAVDRELEALEHQASRFRGDSEISRLHRSKGEMFLVSDGLAEAIEAALAAARWTNGLVDPTVGGALVSLGYDRDLAAIDRDGDPSDQPRLPAPGWGSVRLEGRIVHLPHGITLDLGATAKGLGSDRAAAAAFTDMGRTGGVLVSLGGDIAVAGRCPQGGWPVLVDEDPIAHDGSQAQVVRLIEGALATSSVGCRRWRRGDQDLHHIIDPRTGSPSTGPWRTASVAALTCVVANAASTALIVGGEEAERWLSETGLPARLVGHDGLVRFVGSWPRDDGGALDIPPVDYLGTPIRALRSTS
jgi:thiamine biosynthesis lipoprotein